MYDVNSNQNTLNGSILRPNILLYFHWGGRMQRIRELRNAKNLTQEELGKILNVSARSIGFYESGDRDPDTKSLNKLADYFGVTIDYIIGRSDNRDDGSQSQDHNNTDTNQKNTQYIVDNLERLAKLLDEQKITDEEYNLLKKKLLQQ